MAEDIKKEQSKKPGRPRKAPLEDVVANETNDRLEMSDKSEVTVQDVAANLTKLYAKALGYNSRINETFLGSYNKMSQYNPFLQNQRIKRIYSQAKRYEKADISEFLASPGNHEEELRSLGWANASSQQIYYNILRRSADVPLYNYFLTPELLEKSSDYKEDKFKNEDRLINEWVELFNIPNTFKTIALEVKREGKSSYLILIFKDNILSFKLTDIECCSISLISSKIGFNLSKTSSHLVLKLISNYFKI